MGEIAHVQNPVTEYARARGWRARRMQYIGRRGCPDTWFFKNRRIIIVEFKDADGKLSKLQEREIARLIDCGLEVHVIDNVEDGYALFD